MLGKDLFHLVNNLNVWDFEVFIKSNLHAVENGITAHSIEIDFENKKITIWA